MGARTWPESRLPSAMAASRALFVRGETKVAAERLSTLLVGVWVRSWGWGWGG